MYSLDNLRRIANPSGIAGALSHFAMKFNRRWYHRRRNYDAIDMIQQDWDNLFILDGCRYDLFEEQCTLSGDLSKAHSPASWSLGFMNRTFEGRELHDTVYVTANPYVHKLSERTFHAVINLLDDGWDDDLETVRPETVADAVVQAAAEYPHKRLIAHFMQPHYPFIGETGRQIEQGGISSETSDASDSDIWTKMQFGLTETSRQEVLQAYRENLDLVLAEIENLLEDIEGKSVITADHGNMLGERAGPIPVRVWGHPPGVYAPELIDVPWFVAGGERRQVQSDPPDRRDKLETDVVGERLADLGYR